MMPRKPSGRHASAWSEGGLSRRMIVPRAMRYFLIHFSLFRPFCPVRSRSSTRRYLFCGGGRHDGYLTALALLPGLYGTYANYEIQSDDDSGFMWGGLVVRLSLTQNCVVLEARIRGSNGSMDFSPSFPHQHSCCLNCVPIQGKPCSPPGFVGTPRLKAESGEARRIPSKFPRFRGELNLGSPLTGRLYPVVCRDPPSKDHAMPGPRDCSCSEQARGTGRRMTWAQMDRVAKWTESRWEKFSSRVLFAQSQVPANL